MEFPCQGPTTFLQGQIPLLTRPVSPGCGTESEMGLGYMKARCALNMAHVFYLVPVFSPKYQSPVYDKSPLPAVQESPLNS